MPRDWHEIVLTPVDRGWTWVVRLCGESILKRGRAGNLCVAAMDAADALDAAKRSLNPAAKPTRRSSKGDDDVDA